jgi:hypothetical protein
MARQGRDDMTLRLRRRSRPLGFDQPSPVVTALLERYVTHLAKRVPELEPLAPDSGLDQGDLLRALDALEAAVPIWHEEARETLRRNAIVRLLEVARSERTTR